MRGLCFCIPGAPSGPPEIVIDSRGGEVLQVRFHILSYDFSDMAKHDKHAHSDSGHLEVGMLVMHDDDEPVALPLAHSFASSFTRSRSARAK